jgi:hypothetical protein
VCTGTLVQEAVALYAVSKVCSQQLLNGSAPAPLSGNPFRAAKVTHALGQDFRMAPSQNSLVQGTTDQARLSFWTSRLNDSRDPAAPLAIDVVKNAYALGCYANERLKAFAADAGVGVSLTPVGVSLMQRHAAAVDTDQQGLPGKLSARQIAQYHHVVFGELALPTRTFGGTPLTGQPAEADTWKFIWCPSCE